MRERLVIAFVGLTIAVIVIFGIPRAYFLADLVREREQSTLDGTATTLAALVRERERAGGDVDVPLLEHGLVGADHVEYVPADGPGLAVGNAVSDPSDSLVEERTLGDGSVLTLRVAGDTVARDVQEAITPLVLLGLALAAGSAVLGFGLARRLSRPFRDLARFSRDLGHGRFDIAVPSYSVPEAEAIGVSLRGAAAQLDQLVRHEREFAVNASHQLRTPITALRLGLEDLSLWPETDPKVQAELERVLGELDRLSAAIDELLDLSRGRRLGEHRDVDLSALVAATALRWQKQVEDSGRRLVVQSNGKVPARLAPGPVEQVLDVLIDNARVHGRGTITVQTRHAGTHLEVAVMDEGEPTLRSEVFQRGVTTRRVDGDAHGIGLAVASELSELSGGHLSLDASAPTTRFVLWLPVRQGEVIG
ncbi:MULTISPECIES: sensor histidine kinase [Nocardioides]|uniref:histidine kinase n=1 Tax=Nocardioides vastitatis TaxID=2568655 RepID=A0ABW0ZH67_9ACTN|nr:HAMP domain-containing sensor histidine kinase [Nocardioides sp.]THI92341.1 HAMP domain-containing histidine kinase [Nocardioides sp.]